MAEIKPKIVDGIKYWNIDSSNASAYNREFERQLLRVRDLEEAKLGRKLKPKEISKLRRHPELGVWLIDGKPATVDKVNQFINKKIKTLSLKIPKQKNTYFTRSGLESVKNLPPSMKRWFKRLDKEGWPEGTSPEGFFKYINDSKKEIQAQDKVLSEALGFNFQAGHWWSAIGAEDARTVIGPYGFGGGKYTLENLSPQPASPSLKQLLSKWNILTPNIPSKFDARGVQIESAEDLLSIGAGGQGWQGAFVDYMFKDSPDISRLSDIKDPFLKSYIAFGDPSRGAGGSLQQRLAQVEAYSDFQPSFGGTQTNFFKYLNDKGVYTPPTIAEQLAKAQAASKKGKIVHLIKNTIDDVMSIPGVKPTLEVADTVRKNPVVSTILASPLIGAAFDAGDTIASGLDLYKNKYEGKYEKLEKTSDKFKFISGSTGLASLRVPLLAPTSIMSYGIHRALEHRINREKKKDKRIENFLNPPNFGQTELKQYDPYEGISTL